MKTKYRFDEAFYETFGSQVSVLTPVSDSSMKELEVLQHLCNRYLSEFVIRLLKIYSCTSTQ